MSAVGVSDRATAEARRDRIRTLLGDLVRDRDEVLQLVVQAAHAADHLVLGFDSWTEFVQTEFGGLLARLDRDDRRESVAHLAMAGLSFRAIAAVVAVDERTVRRDAHAAGAANAAPVTVPDNVVGIDGKRYARPEPQPAKPARRTPLPDQVWRAVYDLQKAVERLERLTRDDRLPANRAADRNGPQRSATGAVLTRAMGGPRTDQRQGRTCRRRTGAPPVRRAYVYEAPGHRGVLIRGAVRDWLIEHKIPARRDNIAAGWWLSRERLPDVLAALQADGIHVRAQPGMPPPPRRRAA